MSNLELQQLFIGDTVQKTISISGVSPLEYTLKYEIGSLVFTCTDDGVKNFLLNAKITGITTGKHAYRITLTQKSDSTIVNTIVSDHVSIIDLSYKSHARKVLEAIEATLEGTATQSQSEFMVNGRSIKYKSNAELLQLRAVYKREVANEEAASRMRSGLGSKNKVLVRF